MSLRSRTRTDDLDLTHTNGNGTTWLKVSRIGVDPNTQRRFRPMHAKNMANHWDDDLLGIVHVSARKDGYYAIDGQHRVAALMMQGRGDEVIECKVVNELSIAEESKRFAGLNTAKAIPFYDKFRVRLNFDETAIAINQVIENCGFAISDQTSDGHITAIAAAEDVYLGKPMNAKQPTPWALSRTLRTLSDAFGLTPTAYEGHFIRGLGAFHIRYGNDVDQDVLVKKLARMGLAKYGNQARTLKEALNLTLAKSVAQVTLSTYNAGRRTATLPEWTRR